MTSYLPRETGVFQEAKGQLLTRSDSRDPGGYAVRDLAKMIGRLISQLLPLDVAPKRLDRIKIRGIGGQMFHVKPVTLLMDKGLQGNTLVRRQIVPHQDDRGAPEMAFELFKKVDELRTIVTARSDIEINAAALAVPAVGQGARDRELVP